MLFGYDGKICLNVSPKRINKNDSTKLENDFIASLSIQNHHFTDFFSFYNSYLDKIIAFKLAEYTGDLSSSDDTKELLEKIKDVEANINDTVSRIKKETSLKDKVTMNIELKKLKGSL